MFKNQHQLKHHPDFYKKIFEIVADAGFVFETHQVETEDHYILNMHRIRAYDMPTWGTPAVFMQHGIQDSSDCWVMHYPELAPAFQLVREGYDVWLGNQRGTKYSLGHK